LAENLRVAHGHSSTLQVGVAPLEPVTGLVEVEAVAVDEVMAVAATFEIEIEIETETETVTETQEIASATFETPVMDHHSGAMPIATTVVAGTVSSIHDLIA
jgi:hypothetical protein